MNKRNDALNAVGGMFRAKPAQQPAEAPQTSNVVTLAPESETPPSEPQSVTSAPKQARADKPTARRKGNVAATAKRVSLYLPEKAKRKVEEIAFHDRRKEHDVFVEALREYLEKRGHKGLL